MINGKSITIASIAWGEYLENARDVVLHCNKVFPFFDKVYIIDFIKSLVDYNKFIIEDLNNHIDTDFVLIVQGDGFITNPHLWSNKFLDYDYIGAPWPWHGVCGNGGFCLRSKKFLEVSSKLKYIPYHPEYDHCPEDSFLCHPTYNRQYMINNGVKFADIKTALEFSFEHPINEFPNHTIKDSFGFHGKHNINNLS